MQRLILGDGKVSRVIRNQNDVIISHRQLDITDQRQVLEVVSTSSADVIINCVAKTNLEWCQDNRNECFEVNTRGALNVLVACAASKKKLVHISSGCLFDGNDVEITEDSIASPAVWYTWTKLWADQAIQNYGYENFLILRPRQLVSAISHPTNLLTKFSNLKNISAIDEKNSITCIEDFGMMIDHLLHTNQTGIFNCANSGTISPYLIAKILQETISPHLEVEKVDYREFLKTIPNKRVNTVLSTLKLEGTGFKNRDAKEAVEWCIKNYKKY